MKKIGWIGVGLMGAAIVPRLIDAGYELYVCDAVKEHCDDAVARGAKYMENPAALTAEVDYVFSMIPNAPILKAIALGENGVTSTIKPGQIYVDLSTVDPTSSAEVNAAIEAAGAKHIRVCVSGSVMSAKEGTLTMLASGPKDAYDEVFPLVEIIGSKYYYLGGAEESRYMKIIVNMLLASSIQAMAESLVMGEAVGIDWEQMLEVIADSSAANLMIKQKKPRYQARDFSPMFTGANMVKDVSLAMQIAKDNHLAMPMASVALQMYSAMEKHEADQLDYSAVLLVNEALNGIKW